MNVDSIIQGGGILAIVAIIFAESGMMLGFFLPGDTLLLATGVFAEQGKLPVPLALAISLIAVAAILGDNTGYQIGKLSGKRLFGKKDGILFRQEYVERTEKIYEGYGGKIMLLAHFIPIVRTFAPVVAGIGKMRRTEFFIFDAIGDIAWSIAVTMIGYWFGSKIPNVDRYIVPTVFAVTALTFGPMLWHIFGDPKSRKRFLAALKKRGKSVD
jgi:membrane-associated protein